MFMVAPGCERAYYKTHLRKVAAQGNADGCENVVYASWRAWPKASTFIRCGSIGQRITALAGSQSALCEKNRKREYQ